MFTEQDVIERADPAEAPSSQGIPLAAELEADPGLLVSAIGYHQCGAPRAHILSPDLERAILDGEIRITDFVAEMPLRPLADDVAALKLVSHRREGEAHWHLKRCAWVLAAAMLPTAEVRPEATIDPKRRKKRADVIAFDEASGRSLVFEVGAVSNDSILVALDAGHTQVVVLPHQSGGCHVAGYVFSSAAVTPLPAPCPSEIRGAEVVLQGWLHALTSSTPLRPVDIQHRR